MVHLTLTRHDGHVCPFCHSLFPVRGDNGIAIVEMEIGGMSVPIRGDNGHGDRNHSTDMLFPIRGDNGVGTCSLFPIHGIMGVMCDCDWLQWDNGEPLREQTETLSDNGAERLSFDMPTLRLFRTFGLTEKIL